MTNVLRFALLAFTMSGVVAAPALAGGGSTKSKPDLTVENEANSDIYVVTKQTNAQLQAFQAAVIARLQAGTSPDFEDAFTDLGGRIVEDGNETTYENVRKGNHVVAAANKGNVDAIVLGPGADAAIAAEFDSATVDVQADTTVVVDDDGTGHINVNL